MKTITKKYKIYKVDELTQEARERAKETYRQQEDFPFLQDNLREYVHEELTERGYTHDELTPLYDLSSTQGSGLMFEGTVYDKKGNVYTIKNSGHYTHEKSTDIEGFNESTGEYKEIDTEKWEEEVYIPICKIVRDRGYDIIDYTYSEENFIEMCEANEYTFLSDGTMFNE